MDNPKIIKFDNFPFFIGLLDHYSLYDRYELPNYIPISISYNSQSNIIEQDYSVEI